MSEKRILIAVANAEAREEFRQAFAEQWQVNLVSDGKAALADMEKNPCDVLVADLDLPEVDGAELSNQTRKKHPNTILFILAAEADKERVLKNVHGAHQFLAKPCDKAVLKSAIERALALDTWIANNRMRELVARIRTFPTVPSLYFEVLSALRSPNSTTEQIGAIIAKDMAMMTKLLQVLNSACFGLSRRITNPAEAVGILGFETVKSMVMTIKLLNQYDKIKPVYFSIDRLWRHSTDVARNAKKIVLAQTDDRALAETAFTAGLMHDLGKIVLAANFDEQYRGAQSLARKQRLPLYEVEKEFFGAGHGEIGAYLLGLWGMPLDLLEVAALHHEPTRAINKGFTVLTAVHVANALEYEGNQEVDGTIVSKVDEAYLKEIGLLDRLSVWRDAVADKSVAKTTPATAKTQSSAKVEAQDKPKPRATMEVKTNSITSPAVPQKPVAQPKPSVPTKATEERIGPFTRKQCVFAGVGGAATILLLAWLVTSFAGSGSGKLDGKDPVVARAREAAPTPTSLPAIVDPAKSKGLAPTNSVAAAVKTATMVFADLKLQGIFYSAKNPTAILNGKMVATGDHVSGTTILQIGPSSIRLQYKDQIKTLVLK